MPGGAASAVALEIDAAGAGLRHGVFIAAAAAATHPPLL
jgi:hypothetical protein